MANWDEVADLVIIGSGGGALTAALVAHRAGATPLVLEKADRFGGSTAMSGGVLWLPANPVLERSGGHDTIEAGRAYLNALIDDDERSPARSRREAFLQAVRPMVRMLEAETLRFYACEGYSDYYDELPGGRGSGRAIGARMISAKRLGDLADRLMLLPGWNAPVKTDEFAQLSLAGRTLGGKLMAARVAARSIRQRLDGAPLYYRGAALQARMLLSARRRGIDLRSGTQVTELISDEGRIVGVRVAVSGRPEKRIGARLGVLAASGGFARNAMLRERFQQQPVGTKWTMASPGDTGDMIIEGMRHGAAVETMAESWWLPMSLKANGAIAGFHSPQEMQKPFCIAVDSRGERFVNEAASYMEIGQAMYARNAIPAWIIMDARHRRFYPWGAVPPGVTPSSWLKSGYLKRADTLADLAAQCGIDAQGLVRTVVRFNAFAASGLDEDFKRGARAYDRCYADPRVSPNPALGALEQAPFDAIAIVPGDVGTAGGLATDEHAQVLREDGAVIKGLYACGNCAAPLFGSHYPGPGASIAASFAFGYIAARHAVGANAD